MTPTSTAMHTLLHRAQTFLAVVDFGSYTRAADFLGISKAMASLHVKSLEEALSVALLVRNTRSRSEEHTSELQSPCNIVCRLLLEKKKDRRLHVVSHLR